MTDTSWLGPAIDVRPLLAEQQAAFIDLLHRLNTDEWAQPTICPGWNVKDVAAHVLGDHIGRLSIHRDGFRALHPRDGEAFPDFLDRINDEWVNAARRISPPMLIELLTTIGNEIVQFWQTVDLDAIGGLMRRAARKHIPSGSMSPGSTPSTEPTSSRFAMPPDGPDSPTRTTSAPSSTRFCGPCHTRCAT